MQSCSHALSHVGESVDDPGKYWRNNVMSSLRLLQACVEHEFERVIFYPCNFWGSQ